MESIIQFKKIGFLILGLQCASVSLAQLTHTQTNFMIIFPSVNSSWFDVTQEREPDTIKIYRVDYEDLDGRKFEIQPKTKKVYVQFEFGFAQYTIDDNPAGPIDYSEYSDWIKLKKDIVPAFYEDHDGGDWVHILFHFESKEEMAKYYFQASFDEIKSSSVEYQTGFYKMLLSDPKLEVFPDEYAEKARKFIQSDKEMLLSIEDLELEFYLKSIFIKLVYSKDHVQYVQVLDY